MASVSQYDRGGGNRSVVVCGGWNENNTAIASCEELIIDVSGLPASSSWRLFAVLPVGLTDGCMLQVNGAVRVWSVSFLKSHPLLQLYHIGGYSEDFSAVNSVYMYDEASGHWQSTTPLPQALYFPKCTVLDCQGLVCDGQTASGVLSVRLFPH